MWEKCLKRPSLYKLLMINVLLVVWGLALISCGNQETDASAEKLRPYTAADAEAVSQSRFPSYVTDEILDGYLFAVDHPEVLRYMPCYCGCGLMNDHVSNLDCYIQGIESHGKLVFSDHATHCDVCLEIARDARRLLQQGTPLSEIRAYVDREHGEKGPGTKTPRPSA